MRTSLKNVRPNIVEQMHQCIFTTEPLHSKCQMFDSGSCSLSMYQISICQCIFKQWSHSIDVIFCHLTDIFEHECETFQNTVLHVKLLNSVFVHESRQNSERSTALRNDCNSNGCADSQLSLLNLKIVKKSNQNVLWTNGFGNESKSNDCSSSYIFLMGFEHFKQIKADSDPLLWRYFICTFISYSSYEFDTVLLYFFISIFKNGCQPRQQIFDRRCHFSHTNLYHNCLQSSQDTSQNFRILFSQTFVEIQSKSTQSRLLSTNFHRVGYFNNKICSLLPNSYAFMVESPVNSTNYLNEIRLCSQTQGVNYSSKSIKNDVIICILFMESCQNAVHQFISHILRSIADFSSVGSLKDFCDSFHDHFSKRFVLVFQTQVHLLNYLNYSYFYSYLDCSLNELFVISLLRSHSFHPKTSEKWLQNILSNILCINSITYKYLFEYFEDNFSHFIIWRFKLSDKGRHNGFDILICMSCFHQWEDKSNCFQKSSQRLVSSLVDSFPKRLQNTVESLDTIGSRSFCQSRQSQSSH